MLQNARVTIFTFSELLRENQQGSGGGEEIALRPPRLGLLLNLFTIKLYFFWRILPILQGIPIFKVSFND